MSDNEEPSLSFEEDFDERAAWEVEQKGWCGIGIVTLPEGKRVKVFFYDPIRLAQDLEADTKHGEPFIAEPGMIVIPSVTREYMEEAVKRLYKKHFFNSLAPIEGKP